MHDFCSCARNSCFGKASAPACCMQPATRAASQASMQKFERAIRCGSDSSVCMRRHMQYGSADIVCVQVNSSRVLPEGRLLARAGQACSAGGEGGPRCPAQPGSECDAGKWEEVQAAGRCSGIRDSSQPGSGRLCRALHSAAVPVAGTVAQGAVWQMQGAEFGVGTQSEEEYKSGMYASKQQV